VERHVEFDNDAGMNRRWRGGARLRQRAGNGQGAETGHSVEIREGNRSDMAKFAVIVTFGDKAKRDETRPVHREYLKSLFDQGKLHESGPFVDDDGALIIYECADEAEARALLAADPYSNADGVVANAEFRGWNVVFPPPA
jgi:hypothetical protein